MADVVIRFVELVGPQRDNGSARALPVAVRTLNGADGHFLNRIEARADDREEAVAVLDRRPAS
jgi:hypothetical protein